MAMQPNGSGDDDLFHATGVADLAQQVGLITPKQPAGGAAAAHSPDMQRTTSMHFGHSPSTPGTPGTPSQSSPWSGQKRDQDFDSPDGSSKRRRAPSSMTKSEDRSGRGLRHFSMKVCQKVQEKGVTSYNEVADELVHEQQLAEEMEDGGDGEVHGPKNIRRRVYDALNVLMAMNIISKEKKEIRWIGLPSNSEQECRQMEEMRQKRLERIRKKTAHLQELIVQQIAFKNLVRRNEQEREASGVSGAAGQDTQLPDNAIHLPFIVVNTSKDTVIDCQMAEDKSEYFFNFNKPFEIHDDIEILKRMRMAYGIESGSCTQRELEAARAMIPRALEPYLNQMVHTILPEASPELGGAGASH
eukprot:m.31217 g.31217  ORF g.31217 m.31217 type:complete len:358 (+) comp9688_c0_seq1:448-1521(+)